MYDPASLITTGFLLPILGGIAVGLRLYCRKVNSAPILIDDYFIVVAQIVLIGMGATQLYGEFLVKQDRDILERKLRQMENREDHDELTVYTGTFAGELGGNTEVSPEGIPIVTKRTRVVLKVQYIEEVIEKIAYGASKLSIIFFYRRIFQIKPLFNIISWTLIALTAIFTVSFTIAVAFQCKSHFSTSWSFASLSDLDTQCMNTVAELIAFSVFDVALDLAILSQPIPLIMGLQMNKRRKLTLLGIFGLGSLSIAAGVVRLAITVHEATREFASFNRRCSASQVLTLRRRRRPSHAQSCESDHPSDALVPCRDRHCSHCRLSAHVRTAHT